MLRTLQVSPPGQETSDINRKGEESHILSISAVMIFNAERGTIRLYLYSHPAFSNFIWRTPLCESPVAMAAA